MRIPLKVLGVSVCIGLTTPVSHAFVDLATKSSRRPCSRFALSRFVAREASVSKGFGSTNTLDSVPATTTTPTTTLPDVSNLSILQLRERLLELLPRMTGQEEEFRMVEALVNALEIKYQPPQTLQFLNLLMEGEWQLLFSTNLSGTPNPARFRLRELFQRVSCNNLQGQIINEATWDLSEAADATFESTGTFQVLCSYKINQGARMILNLDEHILKPARGSRIPKDVPTLVGLLHRSMPKEMFDPADHAVDTTYLDGDLRIVRYTGPRLEGVRDIFIRRGGLQINPVSSPSQD